MAMWEVWAITATIAVCPAFLLFGPLSALGVLAAVCAAGIATKLLP